MWLSHACLSYMSQYTGARVWAQARVGVVLVLRNSKALISCQVYTHLLTASRVPGPGREISHYSREIKALGNQGARRRTILVFYWSKRICLVFSFKKNETGEQALKQAEEKLTQKDKVVHRPFIWWGLHFTRLIGVWRLSVKFGPCYSPQNLLTL